MLPLGSLRMETSAMGYLPAPRLGNAAKAETGALPTIERVGEVTLGPKRSLEPQGRQQRRRPEEPDVRPATPVPREGTPGDWGSLLNQLGLAGGMRERRNLAS